MKVPCFDDCIIVRYNVGMDSSEIWPPPPNLPPTPLQGKGKIRLFRPALLFGIAVNILASLFSVKYMIQPAGAEVMDDGIGSQRFWLLIVAGLALSVGGPLGIWQMRVQHKAGRNILAEVLGLLLSLVPFWSGNYFLDAVINAKSFVVV